MRPIYEDHIYLGEFGIGILLGISFFGILINNIFRNFIFNPPNQHLIINLPYFFTVSKNIFSKLRTKMKWGLEL